MHTDTPGEKTQKEMKGQKGIDTELCTHFKNKYMELLRIFSFTSYTSNKSLPKISLWKQKDKGKGGTPKSLKKV